MSGDGPSQWIVPTRGAKTLPAVEILTGRGFITGKSGSGKSTTASVVAEELLENGYNMLIVDPEGEYFGLKERYELLHVGADDYCDVKVGPQHAEKVAEIALERNMPVILDVSDFLHGEEAKELIEAVVRHLFQKEKDVRKPFLLMVEEMQEYLPQQGGQTELAKILERVAKRGRKRGLGLLGMSQRPSSVDKDFITQCDWMVWHRLTWKTDLDLVRNILGGDKAKTIEEFDAGEAYLMTDWDETIERVKFRQKRTHDAGATPGLERYERPDLTSVSQELVHEIQGDVEAVADGEEPVQDTDAANGKTGRDPGISDIYADLGQTTDADATANADAAVNADAAANANVAAEDRSDADAETDADADAEPEFTTDLDLDGAVENVEVLGATEVETDPSNGEGTATGDEELRALVERLRRRNQILEDEVRELRGVLENVSANGPSGETAPADDVPASSSSSSDSSLLRPSRRDASPAHRPPTQGPPANRPKRHPRRARQRPPPLPPERPPPPDGTTDREGVGGVLLEFAELTVFLWRSLKYRVRSARYRLRLWATGGR